jgi:hypothetical protein
MGEPAAKIAVEFKEERRVWLRSLLQRMHAPQADVLATQLAILVEGAIAAALVHGDPKIARCAKEAARVLLIAAGTSAAS